MQNEMKVRVTRGRHKGKVGVVRCRYDDDRFRIEVPMAGAFGGKHDITLRASSFEPLSRLETIMHWDAECA